MVAMATGHHGDSVTGHVVEVRKSVHVYVIIPRQVTWEDLALYSVHQYKYNDVMIFHVQVIISRVQVMVLHVQIIIFSLFLPVRHACKLPC